MMDHGGDDRGSGISSVHTMGHMLFSSSEVFPHRCILREPTEKGAKAESIRSQTDFAGAMLVSKQVANENEVLSLRISTQNVPLHKAQGHEERPSHTWL